MAKEGIGISLKLDVTGQEDVNLNLGYPDTDLKTVIVVEEGLVKGLTHIINEQKKKLGMV